MRKITTLVKFMTEEELVKMLVQIKNFKNPVTKKHHHCYQRNPLSNKWNLAEYSFKLKNLDFVDVLICGEGYVRYSGCSEEVLQMMKCRFGFVEE